MCTGNVTWRGRPVQCCTCSYRVLLKCSLLSFSRVITLGSSHSWSCPSCFISAFFGDPTTTSTVTSSSDSSSWYISTAQSGPTVPLLLMQQSHPTLAFKPLIFFPPTLYLLALHPHHRVMLLAVSLYLLLHLPFLNSLRVLQWNAGGFLASSTKLLHFISSHPVSLICIQESNLNLFSSFLDSLLCDLMAPTPDLLFFLLMSQTLAVASSFSSGAYPSLSFLPPLFLRLTPTIIM